MEDKTMKKVFGIAALLLALAACNKETEITPVEQPSDSKGITITATLAPKTADTKAVADGGDKITVTWAENEHIAILYDKDGAQVADATITAVDGTTGAATIEFTVVSGTPDNTACTLVYPYSAAKDDKSGVKDAATLLSAQDGTLNANLDVRVGAGTIRTTTPSLTVTTQPEAQFAIFKFTVKNADASATIDVKPLIITIGTQDYVITPASATSTLHALCCPTRRQQPDGPFLCHEQRQQDLHLLQGRRYLRCRQVLSEHAEDGGGRCLQAALCSHGRGHRQGGVRRWPSA